MVHDVRRLCNQHKDVIHYLNFNMLSNGLSDKISYATVEWQTSYGSEVVARISLDGVQQTVQKLVNTAKQPPEVVVLPCGKDGVHPPVCEYANYEIVSVVQSEVQTVG